MAISSIYHNVILRTPEQVEAFINALEASEADPYVKPAGAPVHRVTSDPEELRMIADLWEKNIGAEK